MNLVLVRSPLLLLLVVAIAAVFTWWSYGRMVPRPARGQRLLLGGLRFGTIAALLLLLFEPIVQRIATHQERPIVAFLLDDTRSVASTGGGDVHRLLAGPPILDAELRFFRFASDVQPLGEDSLVFAGARTDISAALEEVRRRFERRNLRAVVLVSDGRYNTGRNPLLIAERSPVPIYTVTVGDTLQPPDVLVGEVMTNEIAYVGMELPVRVSVRSEGFVGRRATVALSERGSVLAQQTVVLPEDGLESVAELAFVPADEGLRRYVISVTQFDGEATHANNSVGLTVRVLSARRSVLLLAAGPGPDLSALRQELERNPNLDIEVRTPRAPGEYYEGAFPDRLDRFDVVILAGFPGRAAAPEDVRAVARAAGAGLPVLFVLTQQTDLTLVESALRDVLPVTPEAIRSGFVEAQAAVTRTGASHPVLQIPGIPVSGLDRLPPVLANESRWTLSPDSRTLAGTRIRGVELDDPLLAVRRRGTTRSAALLAAASWRWRNLPPDLDHLSAFYPGLIQNLVSWVTAAEDDRPVRVRPLQDLFDTTEPARFTGQVYDEALQPVSDAVVHLTLISPDGSELPFTMRPLGSGRFDLTAGALPEGDYTYAVRAERGGVELGTDRGAFAVGTLDLEMRHTTADAALMREIARRSGGEALFADDVQRLSTSLSDHLVRRAVTSTSEFELRRLAPLLALLVGLLSAEWVLRKRAGMV